MAVYLVIMAVYLVIMAVYLVIMAVYLVIMAVYLVYMQYPSYGHSFVILNVQLQYRLTADNTGHNSGHP